jgi:hypothetical protein
VPKKKKTDSWSDVAAGQSSALVKKIPRRRSTKPKSSAVTQEKTAPRKEATPLPPLEPSHEEIRMRAYFISERRHRLGLPGDSDSDWLEAKRQLLSELGPR